MTAKKPQIKREVSIQIVLHSVRMIAFYSTGDAVTEFYEFGVVMPDSDTPNRYRLYVDARYDFAEVIDFIQNYG